MKKEESQNKEFKDRFMTNKFGSTLDWTFLNEINHYDKFPALSDRFSESSCHNIESALTLGNINNGENYTNERIEVILDRHNSQSPSMKDETKDLKQLARTKKCSIMSRNSLNFQSSMVDDNKSLMTKTKKIISKISKNSKDLIKNLQKSPYCNTGDENIYEVKQYFSRIKIFLNYFSQFSLIRDQSSFYKIQQNPSIHLWSYFKEWIKWIFEIILSLGGLNRFIFKNRIALLPTDQLNVLWMSFQLIFNSFIIYYASVYIVFDFRNRLIEIEKKHSQITNIYNYNVYILIFSSSLDILKGFNTAYYSKGETIIDRQLIYFNYLRSGFTFDILSLLSVILSRTFFPNMNQLIIYRFQFLIFFKIYSVINNIQIFVTTFIPNEKYDNIIQLFRLFIILGLTSHINAMSYHIQAQLQIYFMGSEETWLHQADLVESSCWVRYLYSFYCSAGILLNAIIYYPQTNIEIFFMTFGLLINCCIFGYVINELGNIMDNIEKTSKSTKKELRLINSYLQQKKVNRELQTRIRNYLEYIHYEERQLNLEETKMAIEKLSKHLQLELTKEVNSQYGQDFYILKDMFSKLIQEKSLFIMQYHKYAPGEVILQEENLDDCSIYLIWEGKVDLFHKTASGEDYIINTLSKGECFGEMSFFTGQRRAASAKCNDFTSVIAIQRSQFIDLLKEHSQDDFEIFMQTNHLIQGSNDFSILANTKNQSSQGRCYSCGRKNHIAKNCSLTHFAPLPVAVVLNPGKYRENERIIGFLRKKEEKWHVFNYNNFKKYEHCVQRIQEDNCDLIEELEEAQEDTDYYHLNNDQDPYSKDPLQIFPINNLDCSRDFNLYDTQNHTQQDKKKLSLIGRSLLKVENKDEIKGIQIRSEIQKGYQVRNKSNSIFGQSQMQNQELSKVFSIGNPQQQNYSHGENAIPSNGGSIKKNNSFSVLKSKISLPRVPSIQIGQSKFEIDAFSNIESKKQNEQHPVRGSQQQEERTTGMKNLYEDITEYFKNNVQIHIDQMHNFKKYFPSFNIKQLAKIRRSKQKSGKEEIKASLKKTHFKYQKNQLSKLVRQRQSSKSIKFDSNTKIN